MLKVENLFDDLELCQDYSRFRGGAMTFQGSEHFESLFVLSFAEKQAW